MYFVISSRKLTMRSLLLLVLAFAPPTLTEPPRNAAQFRANHEVFNRLVYMNVHFNRFCTKIPLKRGQHTLFK